MATEKNIADFIADQVQSAGIIRTHKMFGEYALYCNDKVVALICDNKLFVKPTKNGKNFIGSVVEAPPFPGATNFFLVSGDLWEDAEWIAELIKITAAELPLPKPKKPRTCKTEGPSKSKRCKQK